MTVRRARPAWAGTRPGGEVGADADQATDRFAGFGDHRPTPEHRPDGLPALDPEVGETVATIHGQKDSGRVDTTTADSTARHVPDGDRDMIMTYA
jgi:hypothetical protein